MKFKIVIFVLTLFFGGAVQAAPMLSDERPEYLQGYVQALLDARFAQLALESLPAKEAGVAYVTTTTCLNAAEEQEISAVLTATPPVHRVVLDHQCRDAAYAPAPTVAATREDATLGWLLFPDSSAFQPPAADPRQPQLSMGLYRYSTGGDSFVAAHVNAGTEFPIVGHDDGRRQWQLGFQGGFFSVFDRSTRDFPALRNTDFLVAFPIAYRNGGFSSRLRLVHESGHLGDEFIDDNPGVRRVNVSRETLDAILSLDWPGWRIYGGAGYVVRHKQGEEGAVVQTGFEVRVRELYSGHSKIGLLIAGDLGARDEEGWTLNHSLHIGPTISRGDTEIRTVLQYYNGRSPNGQFAIRDLSYWGIGTTLEF